MEPLGYKMGCGRRMRFQLGSGAQRRKLIDYLVKVASTALQLVTELSVTLPV
jgi:hypothetical protein